MNRKRKLSEFKRCYGSRARVSFIKNLPRIYCNALSGFFGVQTIGKCDNAHTVTDGMGRKAGYETIVPLCRTHHRSYDTRKPPFDNEEVREGMRIFAANIESVWQESLAGRVRRGRDE